MTMPTWKNSAALLPTTTPSQIILHHISVGKLLNYTVYHMEVVMEKKRNRLRTVRMAAII